MASQKKNRKLAATKRKLKNARQRMKNRLEKMGLDKKTITTLLDSFRDEFVDKSGRINVGGRKNKNIDRKIMEHVKSRFMLTGEELVNLLRTYYPMIDTQGSGGPLINTFGTEIFSDGWDEQLDINTLGEFYKNIGPELEELVGDSIKMKISEIINSKFS